MRRGIVGLGLVMAVCLGVIAATAVAGHAAPSTNARLLIFGSPGMVFYVSPAGTGDPRHVRTATGIRCGGQCTRLFPVGTKVTIGAESKNKSQRAVWNTGGRGPSPLWTACEGKSACSFAMPERGAYFKTLFCAAKLTVAQCRAYIKKFLGGK